MSVVTIIVCTVIAICSYYNERNLFNPVTIMSGIWGLITFFASLRLYNMYPGDDLTYSVITVGIVMFAFGALTRKKIRIKNTGSSTHLFDESKEYDIDYTLLLFLSVISVAIMLYPAIVAGNKVFSLGYSFSYVRRNIELYDIQIFNLIYNYIAFPFSIAVIPIFAVSLLLNRTSNKLLGFLVIVIVFERVMIEGGRFLLLYLVCDLSIAYAITERNHSFKLRFGTKILIISIVILCFVAIFFVSSARGIENFWESIYIYFCGVIPHLTKRLEIIQDIPDMTFGLSSLNGFFEFIFTMADNFGFDIPEFYLNAKRLAYVENIVTIGEYGMTYNAFVGPFFYMFLDGRYFGVVLGMFIFGWVSYHFYRCAYGNLFNIRSAIIYVLIAQSLMLSMVRIEFANLYYVLSFFYIYVIVRKKLSLSYKLKV